MKQKVSQVAFPAMLVAATVVFLSAFLFANPSHSFAATGKKTSSTVAATSAVGQAEVRIKQLKNALNITEEQKELWENLTLVMRENAKDMDALTKERAEETKTMNAVEHLKFHRQITKAHMDQLEKLIPPFEAFYSSMSDKQMKITDTIFRTGKNGKHKMN